MQTKYIKNYGCTDTTFLQTDTSTSIFIRVLADTEYRYRYFLDLVSMKVQLIWRQILFYPLQIMSSLLYKINRRLSQAKNKQSFLVLTHKKSLQTDTIITLDKMQIYPDKANAICSIVNSTVCLTKSEQNSYWISTRAHFSYKRIRRISCSSTQTIT